VETNQANNTVHKHKKSIDKEKMEKMRQERAKYEVTLSAAEAPEAVKKALNTLNAKDIIAQLNKVIEKAIISDSDTKPKIQGINVLSNNIIRLQCKAMEDVSALRDFKWEEAFPGLKAHKPKYGVVVHGVPTRDINVEDINQREIRELEKENESRGIHITKITTLRRKSNKVATHQSIIIFTHDPFEADQCIKRGVIINYRHYTTERYTPNLNLTQCYKCHHYGHRASQCKHEEKCGKCGHHDHRAESCKSNELKCSGCGGDHASWHHECEKRKAELLRLKELRQQTSPYFTE